MWLKRNIGTLAGVMLSCNTFATDLSDFPPCEAQACQSVAQNEDWPNANSHKMHDVSFQGFHFSIPNHGKETRTNPSFRQIDYDATHGLSLSVYKRSDMDELFKASNYSMIDWADIVFTKTPHDKVPQTKAEAFAWYAVLMSKVVFVGGNMVTRYAQSPFAAYVIYDTFTKNNIIMIGSKKLPNVLLKIELHGFDHQVAKNIIASLRSSSE